MADRREQILSRVWTLLQELPTTQPLIKSVYRNRGELPEDKRPACTMLDGDEDVSLDYAPSGRPQIAQQSLLVACRPEIYIVLDQREPKNENVGQDLNSYRRAVLNLLLNDAELRTLVSSNGEIRYEGCATDLASGRSMQGQLQVKVAFIYKWSLAELTA